MPFDGSSSQQASSHSGQDGSGGRRRRESRAGTRSVSTLSAAQLERKRANDREAQRTIRQRNREHIESLERQVAQLTAKKEQLDSALQQNAVLEAEIERLKRQLATVNHQLRYPEIGQTNIPKSPNYVASSRQGMWCCSLHLSRGSLTSCSHTNEQYDRGEYLLTNITNLE